MNKQTQKKYTDEALKKVLESYGYEYIEGIYQNAHSVLKCKDNEGYIVHLVLERIETGQKPLRFHQSNPDTINNIKHYLDIHSEFECEYVSGEYIKNTSPLTFQCSCGNYYTTNFANLTSSKRIKCPTCMKAQRKTTAIPYSQVKATLLEFGYELLVPEEEYRSCTKTDLICVDKEGYKYKINYDSLINSGHKPIAVATLNPFSIENINLFLKIHANGLYTCISDSFEKQHVPIQLRCNKCGFVFEQYWGNINRLNMDKLGSNKTGASCPKCDRNALESTHASVLKQVWLHEYPDTIIEEKSCRNPNNGYIMPTDIVNHRQKIAIEVQSRYHDKIDQQKRDQIKKDFWTDKGYSFYALDHREYSILEMIQVFFPHIVQIPEYIDLDFSNKTDTIQMQELLDQGYTVPQVVEEMGCSAHNIYDAIADKRIVYPKNHVNAHYRPIVQLDLEGNLIQRYDKIVDAVKSTTFTNLREKFSKGIHLYKGYYWYYEKDYLTDNFQLCAKNIVESSETAG